MFIRRSPVYQKYDWRFCKSYFLIGAKRGWDVGKTCVELTHNWLGGVRRALDMWLGVVGEVLRPRRGLPGHRDAPSGHDGGHEQPGQAPSTPAPVSKPHGLIQAARPKCLKQRTKLSLLRELQRLVKYWANIIRVWNHFLDLKGLKVSPEAHLKSTLTSCFYKCMSFEKNQRYLSVAINTLKELFSAQETHFRKWGRKLFARSKFNDNGLNLFF